MIMILTRSVKNLAFKAGLQKIHSIADIDQPH